MKALLIIIMCNIHYSLCFSTFHARVDSNVSPGNICCGGQLHPTSGIKVHLFVVLCNDRNFPESMSWIILDGLEGTCCYMLHTTRIRGSNTRRYKENACKQDHDPSANSNLKTGNRVLTDPQRHISDRFYKENRDNCDQPIPYIGKRLHFAKTNSYLFLCGATYYSKRKECDMYCIGENKFHKEHHDFLDHSHKNTTGIRLNTIFLSNKYYMQSKSSNFGFVWQNKSFNDWLSMIHVQNISVKLISLSKNSSSLKWLTIIEHLDKALNGILLIQIISAIPISCANGSSDKQLKTDPMQSVDIAFSLVTDNIFIVVSDTQFSKEDIPHKQYCKEDISEELCTMRDVRAKMVYCCGQRHYKPKTHDIPSLNHIGDMKIPNVLQALRQLEEEIQWTYNHLQYTSAYLYLYLKPTMNRYRSKSQLAPHKLAVNTNWYLLLLPELQFIYIIMFISFIFLFESSSTKRVYYTHTSFHKKINLILFYGLSNTYVLKACMYISFYFLNILHHVHKIRKRLLKKSYPISSHTFRTMIIRRYKRYQRGIKRTRVKNFFKYYVKWLKAFDLKEKYGRSANIGHSSLKKGRIRKNPLRGGRKRKWSFRKNGPFNYGKPLSRRRSSQRESSLRRAFNIFVKNAQHSLNEVLTSTQSTAAKTEKKERDALNNTRDLFRLRRLPRQSPVTATILPITGSSMQHEFLRVSSFANIPGRTPVSTLHLARAGFFYTGHADVVECFHCHVKHGNWEKYDVPLEIHKRISPSCDFVHGNATANIAIDRSGNDSGSFASLYSVASIAQSENGETSDQGTFTSGESQTSASTGSDQSSSFLFAESELFARSESIEELHSDSIGFSSQCTESSISTIDREESETLSSSISNRSCNRNANGISAVTDKSKLHNKTKHSDSTEIVKATIKFKPLDQCHDRPKYIAFAVLTVRMSSFKGWSSHNGQTPRELAAAGLFYTGCGDLVRCWFCGISIQQWETEDDPWIEHAKWAPTCLFMRRTKGDEFIQLVHERNNFCSGSNSSQTIEQAPRASVQKAPDEKQTPLQFAAVVERVKTMGYSTGVIQKAIETLKRENTPVDTNSIVTELVENEETYLSTKPDRVKVSELTWNTSAGATGVGSCTNGLIEEMGNLEIQEHTRLFEENKRLRQELKCKICLEANAVITFVPCGHMTCCEACGSAVSKCPVCRRPIEMRVKTWMA